MYNNENVEFVKSRIARRLKMEVHIFTNIIRKIPGPW